MSAAPRMTTMPAAKIPVPNVPVSKMRCVRCLLPAAVPEAALGPAGDCAFCRGDVAGPAAPSAAERAAWREDLAETLAAARAHRGRYQALVCLSGGKDSLLLLHKAVVEHGLRVLAFTTDANLPEVAWKNIRRTVARLGVDHLVYRPARDFYRKLFRHLLTHQEERGAVYTVSYVYAPLFEGDALAAAAERGIPLVLAGYSPGQPEPSRMAYAFSDALVRETDWTPPALRASGAFSDAELGRFWSPTRYASATRLPRYLAPFHAWDYDQDEAMRRVVELGLAANARHASPIFSNYPVNWLLMYADLRQFGFNPYAPEFSALIREGKADRRYWRVMAPVVDFMIRNRVLAGRETTRQLAWLGMTPDELAITEPLGAYDPEPVRRAMLAAA